jgi:NADH:ubiquinone oxidoreductase subunit E
MITITVCIGSSCHLKYSYDVVNELQRMISEKDLSEKVMIKASFCLGNCTGAVCVKVNEGEIISVNRDNVENFFNEYIIKNIE